MAARGPDLLAEEDRRALGIDQQVRELLDIDRVAERLRRRTVFSRRRNHRFDELDLAVEDVAWNLEIRRARRTVEALARSHRDHVGDAFGRAHAGGKLGDRPHHVDMRQVLQRAHHVLRHAALAADVQDRAFGAERRRDTSDRVGAAGPRRRDHAAELAGLACIAVGRMRGDLLVVHVDDADAFVDAAVVDVDDVPATQREDRVDPLVLQGLRDEMSAGDDAGVPALLFQRVLCRRWRRPGRGTGGEFIHGNLR